MQDRLVQAAVDDTIDDIIRWAYDLWEDRLPDTGSLTRRVEVAIALSLLAGGSGVAVEEMVSPGASELHRHADIFEWSTPSSPKTNMVFKEVVEAILKKKILPVGVNLSELSPRIKQLSWHISGVTSQDVLGEMRQLLVQARISGESQSWFIEHASKLADSTSSRLETVFRTNVESATSAARWGQYNDPDVSDMFVGYRYLAKGDHRSRLLHRLMDGFMAVKDDPIWQIVWTPNGYNCRCKIRPVSLPDGVKLGLVDGKGRTKNPRLYSNRTQKQIVEMAESGSPVRSGKQDLWFPDEGFRGNAMMELFT